MGSIVDDIATDLHVDDGGPGTVQLARRKHKIW
jgi:hypothetical protein